MTPQIYANGMIGVGGIGCTEGSQVGWGIRKRLRFRFPRSRVEPGELGELLRGWDFRYLIL